MFSTILVSSLRFEVNVIEILFYSGLRCPGNFHKHTLLHSICGEQLWHVRCHIGSVVSHHKDISAMFRRLVNFHSLLQSINSRSQTKLQVSQVVMWQRVQAERSVGIQQKFVAIGRRQCPTVEPHHQFAARAVATTDLPAWMPPHLLIVLAQQRLRQKRESAQPEPIVIFQPQCHRFAA